MKNKFDKVIEATLIGGRLYLPIDYASSNLPQMEA
jgi:hypothetical protein